MQFNKERGLWFCDVELDSNLSYFPFIRLALSRYQPNSVQDAHLSRIVLADFIQLLPDRYASIIFDPVDEKIIQVCVSGVSYEKQKFDLGKNTIIVTLETIQKDGDYFDRNKSWIPLNKTILQPVSNPEEEPNLLWNGFVMLPSSRTSRPYRLVFEESETFFTEFDPVNVQLLPQSDLEYYIYTESSRQYGTQKTIETIISIAKKWQNSSSDNSRIGIGDISNIGGKEFPEHKQTHTKGIEVDIRSLCVQMGKSWQLILPILILITVEISLGN